MLELWRMKLFQVLRKQVEKCSQWQGQHGKMSQLNCFGWQVQVLEVFLCPASTSWLLLSSVAKHFCCFLLVYRLWLELLNQTSHKCICIILLWHNWITDLLRFGSFWSCGSVLRRLLRVIRRFLRDFHGSPFGLKRWQGDVGKWIGSVKLISLLRETLSIFEWARKRKTS